MTRLIKVWGRLEEGITSVLLILLVALVFMEVIVRAFGYPTTWSVGVAQLVFIWLIFLGANQALRKNAHVGVDVITYFLNEKHQRFLSGLMNILIIIFLGFLIFYGVQMVISNTGRIISGTPIPYWVITLAIPCGSFLMFITALIQMINRLRGNTNLYEEETLK